MARPIALSSDATTPRYAFFVGEYCVNFYCRESVSADERRLASKKEQQEKELAALAEYRKQYYQEKQAAAVKSRAMVSVKCYSLQRVNVQ